MAAAPMSMESIAAEVINLFTQFINEFSNDTQDVAPLPVYGDASPKDYLEQIDSMKENERTTLYVDWSHLQQHDIDLADAIKDHFHYLEPHLRHAVARVMVTLHEGYAQDRDFHISFFNLPHLCAIRELRTDKVATLIRCSAAQPEFRPKRDGRKCVISAANSIPFESRHSFTGTVTRTSDVRPELLQGLFQCELCSTLSDPVAQQFKYTQPIKCKNPTCVNRSEWQLRNDLSKFVDWQRVRVQENASEMPARGALSGLNHELR